MELFISAVVGALIVIVAQCLYSWYKKNYFRIVELDHGYHQITFVVNEQLYRLINLLQKDSRISSLQEFLRSCVRKGGWVLKEEAKGRSIHAIGSGMACVIVDKPTFDILQQASCIMHKKPGCEADVVRDLVSGWLERQRGYVDVEEGKEL